MSSFKNFFQNGASPKEVAVLNSIKVFIERNFKRFSGIISQRDDGWAIYAEKDKSSNELIFSWSKFYIPLVRLVEFQKLFSKTQLISCYYEEKKQQSETSKVDKIYALFVADWVYYHWWKYQQRNQSTFKS